jgi:methylated-DNA-[protein]-cysteine S-methyltransferase
LAAICCDGPGIGRFRVLRYVILQTKWGYFGLAGVGDALIRTCLPVPDPDVAMRRLLAGGLPADEEFRLDPGFLSDLQEQIIAYFEGENVDFSIDPPILLEQATSFGCKVLLACRAIPYGHTRTYSDVAGQVGSPGAARAVGSVMARNPIPLVVPCHRVLRADGGLGGFSAPGGTATKRKMLEHEERFDARHA